MEGGCQEDARFENGGQPAVPVSKKQEVLRLLPFYFSSRTDRGAIRPHFSQNETSVRKDFTNHKITSFLSSGLNTPLFFTPCMEAGCEKNLRFSSRSPRTSSFFPKSLQAAHRFQIWLFLDSETKKERTFVVI